MFHNSVHITPKYYYCIIAHLIPLVTFVTCIHLMICWVTDVKRVVQLYGDQTVLISSEHFFYMQQ